VSYLLDTNAVVALMADREPIAQRVRQRRRDEFNVSALVMHELYYGAYYGQRTNETLDRFDALAFPVLDFSLDDARVAAEIRARLRARGTPIGPYDVLIAGQALARGMTLITRNVREFARVEGLAVENWEEPR